MGFLGALGGMIAPALNTATQAASSYEGAQANAAIQQRQMMIQALVFARQQRQIEIENQLNEAKARLTNSQSDPNFIRNKAAAEAEGAAPTTERLQGERIAGEGKTAEKVAGIRSQATLGAAGINAGSRIQAAGIANTGAGERNAATNAAANARTAATNTAGLNTRLKGIQQQQGGSIIAHILHPINWIEGKPLVPSVDSGVPGAAPSQQQSDWDAAAAHADSLGKSPEQAGLPPRPVN